MIMIGCAFAHISDTNGICGACDRRETERITWFAKWTYDKRLHAFIITLKCSSRCCCCRWVVWHAYLCLCACLLFKSSVQLFLVGVSRARSAQEWQQRLAMCGTNFSYFFFISFFLLFINSYSGRCFSVVYCTDTDTSTHSLTHSAKSERFQAHMDKRITLISFEFRSSVLVRLLQIRRTLDSKFRIWFRGRVSLFCSCAQECNNERQILKIVVFVRYCWCRMRNTYKSTSQNTVLVSIHLRASVYSRSFMDSMVLRCDVFYAFINKSPATRATIHRTQYANVWMEFVFELVDIVRFGNEHYLHQSINIHTIHTQRRTGSYRIRL